MNYRMNLSPLALVAAILTAACGGSTDPGLNAHVRFVVDAPFCSNSYPVNFFIDNVQVGRDTMWFGVGADTSPVGTAGYQKFKSYRSFSVQAGIHTVRAMIVDTIPPYPAFIYSWPDTTVDIAVGAEAVRALPFYCS
jgi:hypothetical protein